MDEALVRIVLCKCTGIREIETPCPACGGPPVKVEDTTLIVDGREIKVPMAFMGAEGALRGLRLPRDA